MPVDIHQGKRKPPWWARLIMLLVWGLLAWFAIAMFYGAYRGVREGNIYLAGYRSGPGHHFERSHQPELFWFGVALYTHLGLLAVALGAWTSPRRLRSRF